MAQSQDPPNAFDVATDNDNEVNEMLADTDGKISQMQYTGTIGYHIHVAQAETDPEYLWKIALLQALDDNAFQMFWVDDDTAEGARESVVRDLEEHLGMDRHMAEIVGEEFEENLRGLIEQQEDESS